MFKQETFVNETAIFEALEKNKKPEHSQIREILQKSLNIETLSLKETAALLNVTDENMLNEMKETAYKVKKKVYDNRIVTFAPLYLSNYCINDCMYCGFRKSNTAIQRKCLSINQIKKEVEILAGKIGHKRLIVVYGEHLLNNIDFAEEAMRTIYSLKAKTKTGFGSIRRININASPMTVVELKRLKKAGIGTFQVFQETYHKKTYEKVHPKGTQKHDYKWRLYCMHRAIQAGVDDVGIGVLFGLFVWKFEVLGLLLHALELEKEFQIGPHTISFPRLTPAINTPFIQDTKYKINDEDFAKAITVIRLAVPYTGMILTARENKKLRHQLIPLGITQTDAASTIAIGGYAEDWKLSQNTKEQFLLKDKCSLENVIKQLAIDGYITSFCTAGYRCGRTGKKIMHLLRSGEEGKFCKLNAVLTFQEWLNDFASMETKKIGEDLIIKEIQEIKEKMPNLFVVFMKNYNKIKSGANDLYF